MKGDFSRFTFNPAKDYSRVLMQQGRVQLDSDWNEQMDILWHYLRTLATDLIGSHGGPEGDLLGFKIGVVKENNPEGKLKDLSIGSGRYYVNGILCENDPGRMGLATGQVSQMHSQHDETGEEAPEEAEESESSESEMTAMSDAGLPGQSTGGVTYYTQHGYPLSGAEARERYKLPAQFPFLVYLDVWERAVSSVEDQGIREVALGGPDTAARSQVVWQVKVESLAESNPIICQEFESGTFWKKFLHRMQPPMRGGLMAKAREPQAGESTDPCITSPDALYRGLENQLYRVEIHTGTGNPEGYPPTFKWSRDNGSNIYPVLSIKDHMIFLEHLGRDGHAGLQAGDWVEVVEDDDVLLGRAQPLYQVDTVDLTDMTVSLKKAPPALNGTNTHPLLRRWDQRAGDTRTGGLELSKSDHAALIKKGWLNLEDGIQVQFQPNAPYRTGDYWLIPARTATGDIEWPRNTANVPQVLPPHGEQHYYAPLAGVFFGQHKDGQGNDAVGLYVIDLRHVFPLAAKCLTLLPPS
jgi:hypothetical protein